MPSLLCTVGAAGWFGWNQNDLCSARPGFKILLCWEFSGTLRRHWSSCKRRWTISDFCHPSNSWLPVPPSCCAASLPDTGSQGTGPWQKQEWRKHQDRIGYFCWNNLHLAEDFSLGEQGGIRRLRNAHCFHFKMNEKRGISRTKVQSTKNYHLFQLSSLGGVASSRIQPFFSTHHLQCSLDASFFYVFEAL